MSAIPHSADSEQQHPPMSPGVVKWRKTYEDAIADGSFRGIPSAQEQFEAVREEFGLSKS